MIYFVAPAIKINSTRNVTDCELLSSAWRNNVSTFVNPSPSFIFYNPLPTKPSSNFAIKPKKQEF